MNMDKCATVSNRPMVGVVRWDAWIGDLGSQNVGATGVGHQVERTLGPRQFHDRLPFFATITGPDSVEARETTQEVMDQNIRYAADAGIDYWAMCWYVDGSGMDTARKLYLSSTLRDRIGYCFIFGAKTLREYFPRLVDEHFRNPCFQTVLGDRPLVYMFEDDYTDDELRGFRAVSLAADLPNPYFVRMGYRPPAVAPFAFDGDFRTGWQAEANRYAGEWIEVDFGQQVFFDKAVLSASDRTEAFEIQYALHDENWQVAASGAKIGDMISPSTEEFARVTATKARLFFKVGKQQPLVYEFQLFDSREPQVNLALNRKYSSSSVHVRSYAEVDAVSEYVVAATDGVPYSSLVASERKVWETVKNAGLKLIPTASTGWDARPRILNPVSWHKYPPDSWCQQATPAEIADHLREAIEWAKANPGFVEANSLMMYAWNEFDEGGWLCPTLSNGTDRIDAVREVLESYNVT